MTNSLFVILKKFFGEDITFHKFSKGWFNNIELFISSPLTILFKYLSTLKQICLTSSSFTSFLIKSSKNSSSYLTSYKKIVLLSTLSWKNWKIIDNCKHILSILMDLLVNVL